MQTSLLTYLHRLSLWLLLPLLLALQPSQPFNLPGRLAVAVAQPPAAMLLAPLKTSFSKPAPPDTPRHVPPVLPVANRSLPPYLPGFQLHNSASPAQNLTQHSSHAWQARAPPILAQSLI